jgi:hypothetical protein
MINQFIWLLLICSANTLHTFPVKVAMGLVSAVTALWISIVSPLYTVADNFPTIFGTIGA